MDEVELIYEPGTGEAITATAPKGRPKKGTMPGKKKGPLDTIGFTLSAFLCPDAYADVPGSIIDTIGRGAKVWAFQIAATLFGATFKAQGSGDGVTWVDITTQDGLGVNRAIDVAVGVGTTVIATLTPATPAGNAGMAYRFYKLQAKNTVAASVASIIATITGKQ